MSYEYRSTNWSGIRGLEKCSLIRLVLKTKLGMEVYSVMVYNDRGDATEYTFMSEFGARQKLKAIAPNLDPQSFQLEVILAD